MSHVLRTRTIRVGGRSYLSLEPDAAQPQRYLVRFCGLRTDPAAMAATEFARVRLMLANLRGQAPYPYPLPERVTIGWIDHQGWHLGRSPYAKPLAEMGAVRASLEEPLNDLMLRVALVAAAASDASPD
ncbi:MAG: hypothetical protein P8Y27_09530 [Chromatiaceae bacterium]|jgi:hypothetical protein